MSTQTQPETRLSVDEVLDLAREEITILAEHLNGTWFVDAEGRRVKRDGDFLNYGVMEEIDRARGTVADLLVVAKGLLAWLDERGPMMGGRSAEIREEIRAAVARAEART